MNGMVGGVLSLGLLLALAGFPLNGLAWSEQAQPTSKVVILATATSLQDSGLLDVLMPLFAKKTGYTVKAVSVGTGQALAMAARGEADVVLTHAPELELKYVAEGSVVNRRLVMHNDFILVGPSDDPAAIKGMKKAADALRRIAERKAKFVSRGDQSGTHLKELALWKAAAMTPKGGWYIESGQGQAAMLILASEKAAYALVDRGTYLSLGKRVRLVILLEGDIPLLNVHHVMEVNPARHPKVNGAGGKAFADFLVSAEAQKVIRAFGVERYGQPLFFPNAGTAAPGGG
jgi:tungstate transport system substrate-binding protein